MDKQVGDKLKIAVRTLISLHTDPYPVEGFFFQISQTDSTLIVKVELGFTSEDLIPPKSEINNIRQDLRQGLQLLNQNVDLNLLAYARY